VPRVLNRWWRRARRPGAIVLAGVVLALVAGATPAAAGYGGGYGGTDGGGLWAAAWWVGNPEGPGPYIGPPSSALSLCSWHDVGGSVTSLGAALTDAGLPKSFWRASRGGAGGGIWAVTRWATPLATAGSGGDHFDLVACPKPGDVPSFAGPDVDSSLPEAHLPNGVPVWEWLFWDTVPDPAPSALPPLIDQAFREIALPRPAISTSPAEVGGIDHATLVNLPTWLWVGSSIWRTFHVTASAGPYVATVWARPVSVTWSAYWNFPVSSADPEHGTTFGPERLAEQCGGPGVPYPFEAGADGPACTATFSQATLGTWQPLTATVTWNVNWALSDTAGVVGGEGTLPSTTTSSTVPLRVMQIESVISSG
jgi:hypothetical protein